MKTYATAIGSAVQSTAFALLVAGFLLNSASLPAQEATAGPTTELQPDAAEPTAQNYRSTHSIHIGGKLIEYVAIVGSIILRDTNEQAAAELFYTAYLRTNAGTPESRPLVLSYNGGPGSASFWLHMGIMGPRRVRTPIVGQQAPAPYSIVDNAHSLLDKADIVMIDPVGTGLSRPVGKTEGKEFWGLDEDARSLTQFIQRFLSQYQRWNSPRYLLGESYGTTRSAVLARHLQDANIDLNGIVLVSAVLDFGSILFPPGAIVPYVVNLPSYAVSAAYLDALPGGPPSDLGGFMKEVEAWAVGDYAAALFAGSNLDPTVRTRVIDQMHRYTGLSIGFIDRADLRVSAPEFEQELLRDRGLVVGRLDSRFTGPTGDALAQSPAYDPQSTALSSAYTSAFNSYLRGELGYDGDREYRPSFRPEKWNWEHSQGGFAGLPITPNVASDLADAMKRNPRLEVLLINGIYDLATPYFAAVWTIDQMSLPADLRDNIARADFTAGHMMYVDEGLLDQWKQTLDEFIDRTSGATATP